MRSTEEVFDAIVDPEKMRNYFIESSTGRMEAGKTLTWKFPEFDLTFPVRVDKVERSRLISFYWDGAMDGKDTLVEITMRPVAEKGTFVEITENEKENNENGIKWLKNNTQGWANFLACLKAYLEFGINLRKDSFENSQLPTKDITV